MKTEKEKLQREIIDALYDKYNEKEYCTELVCEAMDIWSEQQVKNLNIPAVINRRELLIDFLKYINSNDADILKDFIDDDSVDEYLKSINSL